MKVQNIIIDDDELIIINENGGQHRIDTSNLTTPQRVWVDNIKACAVSLMYDFKESDSDEDLSDWDITVDDGIDDFTIWDETEL